jgi:RNase P/RNase MRP subunit p30
LPYAQRPSAVVFASATGFTPDARTLVSAARGPTLILMGGRADGGWDVDLPDAVRRSPWGKLFDLESQDERLKRLLYHLDKSAVALESRGVSVPELAAQLGLPEPQTEALVRQACRQDARLLTVVYEGTIHVCRSPLAAEEGHTMNLRSWIRKLLRLKPTAAERVRTMTAQRVQLEQQRHELDQRVGALETEERDALERGGAAKTDAERRQLAARLVRTRRDLRRVRAQANVFSQQIDILGTHVHHLTLAEQGKRVALPQAEELTREAAEAEHVMSELAANADLAAGIEVGAESPLMAEEEAAIMEEFKQAAASQAPAAAAPTPAEPGAAMKMPMPPTPEKSKAKPELG